jgi:4-aminobutyrate aminotransferase-like enzyme
VQLVVNVLESQVILTSDARPSGLARFRMRDARGVHVWDDMGNRYLDLTSGWNVANAGWNNSVIAELPYRPSWCADKYSDQLLHVLRSTFPGYAFVAGCSGADSIDNALKIARLVTGRTGVLSLSGAYHGSSSGAALAAGYEINHLHGLAQAATLLPLPSLDLDLAQVELVIRSSEEACAIVVETIVTNAGCVEVPTPYLALLRALATELGLLIICDEIGTGLCRSGSWLSHDQTLAPDMVVLGKALTNGMYPLSLTLVAKSLQGFLEPDAFASTFAATPPGCAAAAATLELMRRTDLSADASARGGFFRQRLLDEAKNIPYLTTVAGRGLELAINMDWDDHQSPRRFIGALQQRGVFAVLSSDDQSLMVMPPLIATVEDLTMSIDAIVDALRSV